MNPPNPAAAPAYTDELVYAPAIFILSNDLYPRRLEVVREYVQNASDALDEYRAIADLMGDASEPQIKISVQGKSLLIFDNGIGMDADDMANLQKIAYSEKKAGKEAGYKGIGRLAGIAVANKLKVSSTSYGDPKLHHFEFRAADMLDEVSANKRRGIQEPASEVIRRHTEFSDDDIDPKEHHTLVELREIHDSCKELLDPDNLKEYIGDIGPVDFAPEFTWGERISARLRQAVPDYSPKTIYLARGGERVRIYKPYTKKMELAEPDFIEVTDPANPNRLLAFCWFATKGQEILNTVRPAGKIFTVEGDNHRDKKRFAGLVYKLFGFSIGDRSLPLRTLWSRSFPRALWFTGEIHIIDKDIQPVTDRSDFVDNDAKRILYKAAEQIPSKLNRLAQDISNNRKAYVDAEKFGEKFKEWREKLTKGQLEKAQFKAVKRELHKELEVLRRRTDKSNDKDIQQFGRNVFKFGKNLDGDLDAAKSARGQNNIADVAAELQMTSKAKRVFEIIMETLYDHYAQDLDDYHEIAGKINKALRKKY